jgi:hypothetical protein
MNENENFETLRQLLALKRHEVPPPGYFDRFSGNVIARIRAEENKSSQSWFSKIIEALELKPAFAGAFASAVCLLMLFGIVYAGADSSTSQSLFQSAENSQFTSQLASASQQPATSTVVNQVFASSPTNFDASLQPIASSFGSQNPMFQQASFSLGN